MQKDNHNYPYLKKISNLYKATGPFNNTYVLACQHILEPQACMFDLISNFGIPKENIQIFGKIYSTSNEVYLEIKDKGFKISEPVFDQFKDFDDWHYENCKKEFFDFLKLIKPDSRIIILDDGGELLRVVNEYFHLIPKNVSLIGVEQTPSGFRKLEYVKLSFPIFNVARSFIKLNQESPLVAELGCNRIEEIIKKYNIENPKILIVGLGPIGESVSSVLQKKGFNVEGYDILHHGEKEIIDLIKKDSINILIGATGKRIIHDFDLEKIQIEINHKIFLISMSSADREFSAVYIRNRGNQSKEIHRDVVWENIILINNGFPVTFMGNRYESTPQEIEKTIALLYGSVLEGVTSNTIAICGLIDVPDKINQILN